MIISRSCPETADLFFFFFFELKDASTALERLQVSLVFDIEGAHDVLEALPSTLTVNHLPSRLHPPIY